MRFSPKWLLALLIPVLLIAAYFAVVLNWSYSTGERAGWVQKLSHKGWVCKTWEGELALISLPGSAPEKFLFTVWDGAVAEQINQAMGKRVALHYQEKMGLPSSCFGDTRYYVTAVRVQDEIQLTPGVVIPGQAGGTPAAATHTAPAAASTAASK